MAIPLFGSAGTFLQDSGTATILVPVPAGVAAGDGIVVILYIDTGTVTVTAPPAGFTLAPGTWPVLAQNHKQYVYAKRATGADAGTYSFTLSAATFFEAQAFRYTGVTASGSLWDTASGQAVDDVGSASSPSVNITTTGANRLLIHTATNWAGGTWTPATGFTQRMQGGFGVCGMSERGQAAAGATGAVVASVATADKTTAWLGALASDVAGVRNPGGDALPFFM